jgi:hypothetical protein
VFPDYSAAELVAITHRFAAENGYTLDLDDAALARLFQPVKRDEAFGNARYARTLFEQSLNAQAVRLSQRLDDAGPTELQSLTAADFEAASRALGDEPQGSRRWFRRI